MPFFKSILHQGLSQSDFKVIIVYKFLRTRNSRHSFILQKHFAAISLNALRLLLIPCSNFAILICHAAPLVSQIWQHGKTASFQLRKKQIVLNVLEICKDEKRYGELFRAAMLTGVF